MANYNKQDLSAVGQKITALKSGSDAEMLQGLVGLGLDVFQNIYLDKKQEARSDLTSSLSTLEDSLKGIDYTQSEMQVEIDGEMVNLYDQQVELAEENLENLNEISKDPILSKYKDDIALIRKHAITKLAYQESMKDMREDSLDNLESLANNYMDLVRKDPSFTDQGTWTEGKDIINDIEQAYADFEYKFGKKIPAENAVQLQNVLQQNELDQRNVMADADRHKPGFQVRLADTASPYLENFFEAQGMTKHTIDFTALDEGIVRTDPEYTTFKLDHAPEHIMSMFDPKTEAYVLPDVDMYKNALTSFNKYQSVQTAAEAQNIILQQAAGEAHPFEVMRDWMEAPGDAHQLSASNAIAYQLFSDTDKTIEENLAGVEVGPYKDALKTRYLDLKELKDAGRHKVEFANMQTTYNQRKKAELKATGKTIDQMGSANAEAVRNTIDNLNTNLAVYNAQSKLKNRPTRQLLEIPNFKDEGQTTKNTKIWLTERLGLLIQDANRFEMEGNEPGGEIKLIRDFENASGQDQWVKLQKLVTTYLDSDGFERKDKKEDINAAFDAGEWGAGEEEKLDVQSFYALLKAFRALSIADPEGTTEFDYLQSLLQQ